MANAKATLFFNSREDGYGWSESHWHTSSSPVLSTVLSDAVGLAIRRRELLGFGATISFIRVSADDVKGDSLIADGPGGSTDEAITSTDVPIVSQLVRAEAGTTGLYRSSIFLAGCPDVIETGPPIVPTNAKWINSYNAWKIEITNGKWGSKYVNKAVVPVKVTNIVSLGAGDFTITTAGNHGIVVGDKVRVSGVKSVTTFKLPNKVYQIRPGAVLSPTTFNISGADTGFGYLSDGTVKVQSYIVVAYDKLILRGPTGRKRGAKGGYGALVGRRKVK